MMQVIDIADIERALPLLADLRASLDPKTFRARLSAAHKGGYRMLGLEQHGTILAILGYRIVHDVCWGKTYYIDDLNVSVDARGQGLGGRLLEAAKYRACEEACDHIRLCSGMTRTDAHRFYEAHDMMGFSKQFVLNLQET